MVSHVPGYTAVSGDAAGVLNLWDLRKLSADGLCEALHTLDFGAEVSSAGFDYSGAYVAASTASDNEVRIMQVKKWAEVASLKEAKKSITRVQFSSSTNTLFLASASMDKNVRFYAPGGEK